MAHFPLDQAFHCEDCGQVGNKSERCACCGSQSIMLLANPLNRKSLSHDAQEVLRYIPSWKEVAA